MFKAAVSFLICIAALASCQFQAGNEEAMAANGRPMRIVSLDYCADQYVLALVDREQILALSPDSQKSFSFLKDKAKGIRQVRPNAEDILAMQPDLVVLSYGGGPKAADFFKRAGVPVAQVGWANDLSAVRSVLEDMSAALAAEERGRALLDDFDRRLAKIEPQATPRTVMYLTAGGVTSGSGTLIDEMFRAAGLLNFETSTGWRSIPLERLAVEQPDIVAPAFFSADTLSQNGWSAARHPVAMRQLQQKPVVELDSAWTSCGAWFLINGIEALANAEMSP
ncbi:MAG: iron ABC transporter substrate-binding protein [Hirschia sp.]|nr:iron ABC transporter substrate-binding protein [Hirschia sp.]MBF19841.1 iron ABC transporter substrate-binding protein [Hirschia sp.]|tara:strand:+ start:1966 stop:2808 length:843 start_codon:yes stop_codon:yes gene_type:complete